MSYTHVCKFQGDFSADIEKAKEYFSDSIKSLRYNDANLEYAINTPSSESTFKLNPADFPTFNNVANCLGFINHPEFDIRIKFFRQEPGCIVPIHTDNFGTANGKVKVKEEISSTAIRVCLALSDWDYGQVWNFGKDIWHDWEVGDCVYWKASTPHGTANFGKSTRYNLQITGIPSQETYDLINNQEFALFTL
jgi:hypothetical protein